MASGRGVLRVAAAVGIPAVFVVAIAAVVLAVGSGHDAQPVARAPHPRTARTPAPRVHVRREEHVRARMPYSPLTALEPFRDELVKRLAAWREECAAADPSAPAPPGRVTYVDDGHRQGRLVDGKRDGLWIEWYAGGGRDESVYHAGVLDGPNVAWHPNGALRFAGSYRDGRMDGPWRAWHENGNVRCERSYVDGRIDGTYREYHPNGAVAEESQHSLGVQTGIERGYDADGHLRWEIPYAAGRREGRGVWYDAEGRLASEVTYRADKPHGAWIEYAADGSVRSREDYEDGRIVRADSEDD